MATKTAPEGVSNDELIKIIETGRTTPGGVSKMRALAALRLGTSSRKVEVFSKILENPEEPRRFKEMAVMGLYELGGEQAEAELIKNMQYVDDFTTATVAHALGRIGSEKVMGVVDELHERTTPALKSTAAFAASLLAYRHNLDGYEISMPADDRLMKLESDSKRTEVKLDLAGDKETRMAMVALRQEPVSVSLSTEFAQTILCKPNNFLLFWNSEFAGEQLTNLQEHKALAAMLFRKGRFGDKYTLSMFMLGTPRDGDVHLTLHRSAGELVFAGTLGLKDPEVPLKIQSVARPGAAAIAFVGSIQEGLLRMEIAESAVTVHQRRQPEPSD